MQGGCAGLDAVFANKGSHTPGLNGITKQHVDGRQGRERLVEQLREELLTGEYRPHPRNYIPKANGKLRPLGIATSKTEWYKLLSKWFWSHLRKCSSILVGISTTAIYSSRPQCITPRTCRPRMGLMDHEILRVLMKLTIGYCVAFKKRIQDHRF